MFAQHRGGLVVAAGGVEGEAVALKIINGLARMESYD